MWMWSCRGESAHRTDVAANGGQCIYLHVDGTDEERVRARASAEC